MSTEIATKSESPLSKFDADALKGIGSHDITLGAPRASFLPSNMGEAMEVAKLMAAGNFVPPHLRAKPGDCLAVVMQAARWGMDPFAVGNKTYFVNDRMAYEAQLVNAVINASGVLDGRLNIEWEGEGQGLVCTVTGKIKGDPNEKIRRVELATIQTRNSPLWKQDPHQQIAYFATRAWIRLHAPEVLLGIYTPDEIERERPIDGGTISGQRLTSEMLISQSQGVEKVEGEVIERPAAKQTTAEALGDSIPALDAETANDGTLSTDNPTAAEGPADEDRGEPEHDDKPAWWSKVQWIRDTTAAAKNKQQLKDADDEFMRIRAGLPDDVVAELDKLIFDRRQALTKTQEG